MKKIFIGALALFVTFVSFSQRTCHTMENHERMLHEDPNYQFNLNAIELFTQKVISRTEFSDQKAVINIPVVVHVVYNTSSQNISDAQILSQIDILNKDFRKLNSDWSNTPSIFQASVADCEINFCLASVTPTGAATNGIIRKSTTVSSFSSNDAVKYSAQGGSDAWNTTKYLNLWVCNLTGGLLGYAQFPGGAAATDGVVVNYTAFGNTGTAQAPYNKGRTATHEVGHWLNLRHIWGDANCGSDLVNDTPTHQTSNAGCPSYPKSNSCGTSAEMTMNYMDYTDDACMYMFTNGQKARMQALFAAGGFRESLKSSNGCGSGAPATPQYCSASGANTQYEWISNVKIGSINNTTAGNGGYGNFTSLSTGLTKGTAYTISLTPGFASSTYTEYFKVYIDLNADMDFDDAGELVYTSAGTTSMVSGSISIPNSATSGTTRMRVIMKDGSITGPCESYTYGEVEDYSVILSDATPTCSTPTSLTANNISSSGATLSWSAVSGASNYTLQVKLSSATIWTNYTVTSNSYVLSNLSASSTYNWQVKTNCTSGSSAFGSGSNFTTSSATPTCSDVYESNNSRTAAKAISSNGTISAMIGTSTDQDWFKFSNSSTAKNIKVTLSNLPLDYDLRLYNSAGTLLYSSENGGTTTEVITYNNAPVATYFIRVIGYNGVFSSSKCYSLNVSTSSAVFKLDMHQETTPKEENNQMVPQMEVRAYPNPSTNGNFNFVVENANEDALQLAVIDALGRVILQKELNASELEIEQQIDLSTQDKGIYYLKLFSSEQQKVVKLIYTE